jgi:hypothetical protein
MDGHPEIVAKRVGGTENPVFRHDVAAVGHDVRGKDQSGQGDPEGETDQASAFIVGEEMGFVDRVE